MGVCHREVVFKNQRPSFWEIAQRVSLQTGIVAVYNEQDWSLTNSEDRKTAFGFIIGNQIMLTNWGPQTYLLGVTLHTLVKMGGNYDSKIAGWTARKWQDVAKKVKALPKHDHPD
ncbi:hypothetical protein Slin_6078 [Spirosoma linguale DSM 74]|uniref:Uncharacterized protein n=2 Tax=Spirosoma TaxID=107 RepID=D2QTA8_SPILD|nr:hypothetical protein Slin_6078 [Spirosoma linguale DSM 74]